MTEKQTESSDFIKKATAIAAGIAVVGGAGAYAIGQNNQRESLNDALQAKVTQEQLAKDAAHEKLVDALNANYSPEDVIQKITIPEGGTIEGQALNALHDSLGDKVYNDTKALFYDTLSASAKHYKTVQAGDQFYVIQVDTDGDTSNADEYLVVEPTHIVHTDITELPSPETH